LLTAGLNGFKLQSNQILDYSHKKAQKNFHQIWQHQINDIFTVPTPKNVAHLTTSRLCLQNYKQAPTNYISHNQY
jgi:hypothetical protein